jgi:hypothetical protein
MGGKGMKKNNMNKIITLAKRAKLVWDEYDILSRLTKEQAQLITSHEEEVYLLSVISFCEWVAPNMCFSLEKIDFSKLGDKVKVGEDRDDRPIYWYRNTGHLYVDGGHSMMLLLADDWIVLYEILISYAEMMDQYLKECPANSEENEKIPNKYIDVFKNKGLNISKQPFLEGGFWYQELQRLYNNLDEYQ